MGLKREKIEIEKARTTGVKITGHGDEMDSILLLEDDPLQQFTKGPSMKHKRHIALEKRIGWIRASKG